MDAITIRANDETRQNVRLERVLQKLAQRLTKVIGEDGHSSGYDNDEVYTIKFYDGDNRPQAVLSLTKI